MNEDDDAIDQRQWDLKGLVLWGMRCFSQFDLILGCLKIRCTMVYHKTFTGNDEPWDVGHADTLA